MTTQPHGGVIPEWTRGERLTKARRLTGMNTEDFAAAIGVSQKTVNNAEGDKSVKPITLKMWAFTTGVSLEWLEKGTGEAGGPSTPPDGPRERGGLERLTEQKRARTRPIGHREATARYATAA